ncbi:uncharacterized protein LTR77_001505 [Saxophila tyrrhenica]|uniref:Transcription initiation factor IIF subunit beta n=1 Tax=Saxophila tyrrhenica TaxID=1690608 RepID=A0AAV9PL96_9PEZI|nr:hypothetical protein LTR77_001505 [Saxophila tyrrhenica]
MADTTIKPEIKLDPATARSPAALSNIEEFEDDVDLTIPPLPEEGGKQAWLVKTPDYIWKAWSEIYRNHADDTPIEIGKMRVYDAKEPGGEQRTQIRLIKNIEQHRELPLIYDLDIHHSGYSNTVVFSEKDLPGHSMGPASRSRRRPATGLKPGGMQSKNERYGNKPGSYRTSIPKQTGLAPIIHHVADAHPFEDETYYAHFKKQYDQATKPKATVAYERGINRSLHPGTNPKNAFTSFSLTSKPKDKKGKQREKAVRLSQEELLDRLYQCFRRYRYWGMKALKNELKQPEAFIKQTLASIAVLIREGDFAMNYKLKPEYERAAEIKPEDVKEETATIKSEDEVSGLEAEDAEMDDYDEDDEGDFEDVMMDGDL